MPESTSTGGPPVTLLPGTAPAGGLALGDWPDRGLCVGEDPDLFFPSHGDPGTKAREICAACAVRMQCLDYAVTADEFGIWGGFDQLERRNIGRQRRRRAAARAKSERGGGLG